VTCGNVVGQLGMISVRKRSLVSAGEPVLQHGVRRLVGADHRSVERAGESSTTARQFLPVVVGWAGSAFEPGGCWRLPEHLAGADTSVGVDLRRRGVVTHPGAEQPVQLDRRHGAGRLIVRLVEVVGGDVVVVQRVRLVGLACA
jgi:hypothetical protein